SAIRLLPLDETRLISICRSPLGSPIFNLLDDNLQIIPPDSLATPANLSITNPRSGQLKLEWADVSGQLGYIVERKPVSSADWQVLGETGESENALTFPTITTEETYDYRVTARHGSLLSAPSVPLKNVLSGPPPAPGNFAVKTVGQTSVSFIWSDVDLEDRYIIETIFPSGGWDLTASAGGDATSAKVVGRKPGTEYHFRLAARNALGLSGWVYVDAKTISGEGEIDVVAMAGKILLKDRASIQDFGTMVVGGKTKNRVEIRIRNIGQYDLRNLKLRVTGPNKEDFRFTRLKTTVLESGESATFELVFHALGKGKRRAVLEILSSDTNESPFELRLLGEGAKKVVVTN
ncbi:MAG: fibronectin type III domain-containing protein, partial [Verrucomicrobiaceae bacterium]